MPKKKVKEIFEELVPGVLVNRDSEIKFSVPHPDPCWIIKSTRSGAIVVSDSHILLIFSDERNAAEYCGRGRSISRFEKYSWEDLVNKFEKEFPYAIVDHLGEAGLYQIVPLKKGI
jgi:hypothetical protein